MSDKPSIQSRELLILSSNESKNKPGSGWKLRVVQYHKDGKSVSVKLETGEYWTGDDGVVRFKAKGLALRDLEALERKGADGKTVYSAVKALMKDPPPIPEEVPIDKPGDEAPFD